MGEGSEQDCETKAEVSAAGPERRRGGQGEERPRGHARVPGLCGRPPRQSAGEADQGGGPMLVRRCCKWHGTPHSFCSYSCWCWSDPSAQTECTGCGYDPTCAQAVPPRSSEAQAILDKEGTEHYANRFADRVEPGIARIKKKKKRTKKKKKGENKDSCQETNAGGMEKNN